jgi:hypothetical protein
MRSRQLQGKSPLFEEGIVSHTISKKNIYKGLLKKKKSSDKDVKASKTTEKTSRTKEKAPKDKTPLKSGQARNIDTGRGIKITPAHQKNIAAYNAKKTSQSSKNAPSVNLEENTFTPTKAVK